MKKVKSTLLEAAFLSIIIAVCYSSDNSVIPRTEKTSNRGNGISHSPLQGCVVASTDYNGR
jgi:hypothetical protein